MCRTQHDQGPSAKCALFCSCEYPECGTNAELVYARQPSVQDVVNMIPLRALFLSAAVYLVVARPNIVLILSDDLDYDYKQDRLEIMPNLRRLREAGLHLTNHVAAQPVCGPSRSSLLAGRFPHNAGYIVNDGPESIAAWTKAENNTIGTWLNTAGYYSMFLGACDAISVFLLVLRSQT